MIGDWSCGGLNVLGDAYCLANSNDDTTTVVNTEPEDFSENLLFGMLGIILSRYDMK